MIAFKNRRARTWSTAVIALSLAAGTAAVAQTSTSTVTTVTTAVVGEKLAAIGFVGPDGSSCGRVTITDNRVGPDALQLDIRCLKKNTKYSLLLTQSATPGALPAQLLSEFTTMFNGTAQFSMVAEVVEAFGTANQFLADSQGIANIADAGARNNGAVTIPLDWFSVYESVGTDTVVQASGGSVFGHNPRVRAGAMALTSTSPIPNPPLVANLYGPSLVAHFETKELADQNLGTGAPLALEYTPYQILVADSSTGDIVRFMLEQAGGPQVVQLQSSQRGRYSYRLPVDRNHAGEVLIWRLKAVARNGAISTTTLSQTIVRSYTEAPLLAQLPPVHLTFDRGGLTCACFGNIVDYRWEVLGLPGLTESKIAGGGTLSTKRNSITLNFLPGEVYPVRVTITDGSGATSTARTTVIAVDTSQLDAENLARFGVLNQ